MNATASAVIDAPAARRRARAVVARRLLAATRIGGADATTADDRRATTPGSPDLDWEALDLAPAWFALPDEALVRLACRIGARVHAATLRRWIDNGRLGAARRAVGAGYLRALLAQPGTPSPGDDPDRPTGPTAAATAATATAAEVEPLLRACGFAVLLAALPPAIRAGAPRLWAPVEPAPMIDVLARSLVAEVERIGAAPATTGRPSPSTSDTSSTPGPPDIGVAAVEP